MKLFKTLALVLTLTVFSQAEAHTLKKDPIYLLDGRVISKAEMEKLNPNGIESVNVLKGEKAIEKYGKKAKKGVIEIILKK